MKVLMPLKKAVVEITNEAVADDQQSIRKAVRCWHNRLFNGSVPRDVVTKLGRELFLDLDAWEHWLEIKKQPALRQGPGRPRSM
jgi:hypothetical protein